MPQPIKTYSQNFTGFTPLPPVNFGYGNTTLSNTTSGGATSGGATSGGATSGGATSGGANLNAVQNFLAAIGQTSQQVGNSFGTSDQYAMAAAQAQIDAEKQQRQTMVIMFILLLVLLGGAYLITKK